MKTTSLWLIADELIILEREHAKRAVPSTYALVAARNVLERRGLTIVDPSQTLPPGSQPAPQHHQPAIQQQSPPAARQHQRESPAPASTQRPRGRPQCSYCTKIGHTDDICYKRQEDLQKQLQAMDAAFSAKQCKNPSNPAGTALLAVPEPPVQPAPLTAEVSGKADSYFKKNLVPSDKFWY